MNKLKELSLRLHSVSVMRDLLHDKVIKALMNFLDLDDEVSDRDKVQAYTLFVSELYKTSEESLSRYVKKIVFESENIYVKLKGKGEVPSAVLKKSLENELKTFDEVVSLSADVLLTGFDFLPGYYTEECSITKDYINRLDNIVDVSKKILIVGLGLLGGSYARVLKRFGFHISAITKEQSSIDYAINEGIIDEGSTELDEEIIGNADLVIFALYPHVFVEWIENNQKLLKSGAIITDVTGVKRSIVYKIQDILRDDVEFIAAHPMAGREVSGVENSTDKMFQGANYIVTPTDKNTTEAINTCLELGRLLGFSNVTTLSPEEHDEMIGFLSQLTHCIAITLMTCNDRENMEKFTGDSFRDLTRIARINDLMWSELFVANKDALLSQMDMFMDKFKELKTMLETEDIDGMRKMMRHSTERRALFDKK